MKWSVPVAVIGALLVAGGGYAVWYAFAYPLCLMNDDCSPNAPVGLLGLSVALVGLTTIHYSQRGD